MKHLKIFCVGGYVRDNILNVESRDLDFVVVGSSVEEMLSLGFQQVGKDFPVFQHPQYGWEFALARTERKVDVGYHGFEVNSDPTVTLEQDTMRRDLTINSMCQEVIGWDNDQPILSEHIIDYFGGISDLKHKILRPVSHHFADDPIRVLRAGRFASRYNFKWSNSLITLADQMLDNGELDNLVAERLYIELLKNFKEPYSGRMFDLLQIISNGKRSAISAVFNNCGLYVDPDMSQMFIDVDKQFGDVMDLTKVKFGYLTHKLSIDQCNVFLEAIKAPTEIRRICLSVIGYLQTHQDISTGEQLMKLIEHFDLLRSGQHDKVDIFVVMKMLGFDKDAELLLRGMMHIPQISSADIDKTLVGKQIALAIRDKRVAVLDSVIRLADDLEH